MLYPFLLRDLTQEPFWPPGLAPASDIVSPYGYGGPFTWGDGSVPAAAELFWEAFAAWASETNVVSELARLSLFEEELLPFHLEG